VWIDRDDREIAKLVGLATDLIDELYRRTTGQPVPTRIADATAAAAASRREHLRERDAFRALALAE
jgi:hypothetical protein